MPYRLGLDLGTNSLGWCILELDEDGVPRAIPKRGIGVRIFGDGRDPQSKTSLAVGRRIARGSRRRRDRYLRRRAALMNKLIALGFMPADSAERKSLEALNPYQLRSRALSEPLTPHELGRALFHLHQRRGFRSNRKSDPKDEAGKIKSAVSALKTAMEAAGAQTVGEYLSSRHDQRDWVRSRLVGAGAKAAYTFYPERSMIVAEFDAIQSAQSIHHHRISSTDWDALKGIMFRQRPLKPVDPGRCTLFPEERRAPWALSIAQQFRILSELANLRIREVGVPSRPLTSTEWHTLFQALSRRSELKFERMKSLLKLNKEIDFNLEDLKRDRLKGDVVASALAKKARLGESWYSLSEKEQSEIGAQLSECEDDHALIIWLQDKLAIHEDLADELSKLALPVGYCRLSLKALRLLVPTMAKECLDYAAACKAAGLHHSDFRDGVIEDSLPYYGTALERYVAFGSGIPEDSEEKRVGRVSNPTVHIGLNQVRKVVNEIIDRFGHPHEIVVELARDLKQSADKRAEQQREQASNQKKREQRAETLRAMGMEPSGDSLARMRLWEELSDDPMRRRCVYTGEVISIERLLSGDVDIDHILPFSQTLDDSFNNRITCVRAANRVKRGQAPFEAFGTNPSGFSWSDILERAQELPPAKRWRFAPDAMDRYRDESGFLARQLTETQYLSRLARMYLSRVCHPDRVRTSPVASLQCCEASGG